MRYLEENEPQPRTDGNEILWKMAKTLWKKLTLEEFEEALKEEGYEDFYMRVKIGLQDLEWMKKKYGGDGKGRLRELYKQHQSGELDRQVNNRLKTLRNLKDKYHDFLSNLNDSTHNQKDKHKELVR